MTSHSANSERLSYQGGKLTKEYEGLWISKKVHFGGSTKTMAGEEVFKSLFRGFTLQDSMNKFLINVKLMCWFY